MDIIFKKSATKNTVTYKRSDSSSTWTETDSFMVAHDLAHFAVEKQLRIGWLLWPRTSGFDITDFVKKQKITLRQLPKESLKAEMIVNLILTERQDGKKLENFDHTFNSMANRFGIPNENFNVSDLNEIHEHLDHLLNHWVTLPVNESLILKW